MSMAISNEGQKSLKINDVSVSRIMHGLSTENPWMNEVWDVKQNNGDVYHKDKTVENCFLRYGIGVESGSSTQHTYKQLVFNNTSNTGVMKVPHIVDFVDRLRTGNYMPSFHASGYYDSLLMSGVREFYRTSPITKRSFIGFCGSRAAKQGDKYLKEKVWDFTLSNTGHFAELNFLMYRAKDVDEVNIRLNGDNVSIGSLDFAFANTNLKNINIFESSSNTDTGAVPRSVNAAFEYANIKGTAIPQMRWYRCFEFAYMFDVCNSIDFIPASTTDFSNDRDNTWVANQGYPTTQGSFTQLFCICPNLTKVGPVIDVSNCHTRNKVYRMFGCKNLTQLRLKGINHFDWDFTALNPEDSARQCLPKLDETSVKYLVDNATDLVTQWASTNPGDYNHTVDSAVLNVPASWDGFISDKQVMQLKTKGWTLQVDGRVREPMSITMPYTLIEPSLLSDLSSSKKFDGGVLNLYYNFGGESDFSVYEFQANCKPGVSDLEAKGQWVEVMLSTYLIHLTPIFGDSCEPISPEKIIPALVRFNSDGSYYLTFEFRNPTVSHDIQKFRYSLSVNGGILGPSLIEYYKDGTFVDSKEGTAWENVDLKTILRRIDNKLVLSSEMSPTSLDGALYHASVEIVKTN